MHCAKAVFAFIAALGSIALSAGNVGAQEIGSTVGLTPAAQGSVAGNLGIGTGVVQNEVVRTGAGGFLELKFVDDTHLALSASSTVKLDEFVYSVSRKPDQIVVNMTQGTFRFITGAAPKKAYRIETPVAAIGVRGTIFTVATTRFSTKVTLDEGAIDVCTRGGGTTNCTTVTRPGETVLVTPDGQIVRVTDPVQFAGGCAEAGSGSALCGAVGIDTTRTGSLGGGRPSSASAQ